MVQAGQQVVAAEATARVSLDDAMRNVDALQDLLLMLPDPVVPIEAAGQSVQYQLQWDTNFEDRKAFITGVARYIEEATVHSAMVCWSSHLCLSKG